MLEALRTLLSVPSTEKVRPDGSDRMLLLPFPRRALGCTARVCICICMSTCVHAHTQTSQSVEEPPAGIAYISVPSQG